MTGWVYLVGAGPGDAGLLTIAGLRAIQQAQAVVYDRLVNPKLLEHAPASARLIYAGKDPSGGSADQQDINELLISLAQEGKCVVRLKGGDPMVFGRGAEEMDALRQAGVKVEVIPGVTAGIGGLIYAGIPPTHRGIASSVALVTAQEDPQKGKSQLDYETLARWNGTLVFYMGVSGLADLCSRLIAHGCPPDRPAAVIQNATTPTQKTLTATLGNLPAVAGKAGIAAPALIVVGEVVAMRESLAWFENRPLWGMRIVNTRPKAQACELSSLLARQGAQVLEMPAIRIEPPKDPGPLYDAVRRVKQFDWIIFCSAGAVDAFFAAMDHEGFDSRCLGGVKVCSVGPATAARLAVRNIIPDAQPADHTDTGVVKILADMGELARGRQILVPRADIAPDELIHNLQSAGAAVSPITAYRTVDEQVFDPQAANLIRQGKIDWLTFASPSAVMSFFRQFDPGSFVHQQARVASIGPTTSAELRKLGITVSAEARPHTVNGLVEAILEYEKTSRKGRAT